MGTILMARALGHVGVETSENHVHSSGGERCYLLRDDFGDTQEILPGSTLRGRSSPGKRCSPPSPNLPSRRRLRTGVGASALPLRHARAAAEVLTMTPYLLSRMYSRTAPMAVGPEVARLHLAAHVIFGRPLHRAVRYGSQDIGTGATGSELSFHGRSAPCVRPLPRLT